MKLFRINKTFILMMCVFGNSVSFAGCLDSLPKGNNPVSGAALRAALQCVIATEGANISDATWAAACQGSLSSGCAASCAGTSEAAIACQRIVSTTSADSAVGVGMTTPAVNGVYIKRFSGYGRTSQNMNIANASSFPIRCGLYSATGMPTFMTNYSGTQSGIDTEMEPSRINAGSNLNVRVTYTSITGSNQAVDASYYLICFGVDPSSPGAPNQTIPSGSVTVTWS